jgi:sRNA-binding carbon storage regulator CsrA
MTPIAALFHEGPLRARVAEIRDRQVGLGVQVPRHLRVQCEDGRQSPFGLCGAEGRNHGSFLLSRQLLESVAVTPESGIAPTMPIGRLFRKGPLEFHVIELKGRNVMLALRAPRILHIHRRELPERIRKENAPHHAIGMERPSRVGASIPGLVQDIPREILIGHSSPSSMSGAWMRRTPPDL